MAPSSTVVRILKRKRVKVKFYDSETSDHGDESRDNFIIPDEVPKVKKRKAKSFKSKSLPEREVFPFQLLPPELRNRIYRLALTTSESIMIRYQQKCYRRNAVRANNPRGLGYKSLHPKFLRLCKQTCSEAQGFLYTSNSFLFEDTFSFYTFLASIGTRNVGLLTHLILPKLGIGGRAHNAMDNPAMTLLGSAVNLNILDIESAITKWLDKKFSTTTDDWIPSLRGSARTFYRIAHHWLNARGEAALRILRILDRETCEPREIHEEVKLATEQVFKDELRRLMKR